MVFIKGYKQTEEHKFKSRESRFKKNGKSICPICGKEFNLYRKYIITCGNKNCFLEYRKLKYKNLSTENPFESKVIRLFSTIRLGKGKKKVSTQILKDALEKPCRYCGTKINLENASVDHKEPRTQSKVYNRRNKRMSYSYEEISSLDKKENLQIICRICNQRKGNFNDIEFKKLLNFLSSEPQIKDKIFKRFNMGTLFFKH